MVPRHHGVRGASGHDRDRTPCQGVKKRQLWGFERPLYIKDDQGDTLGINTYTRILLAAWAISVAASQAVAQPATGAVTGVVTGDLGNRMQGVQVTVHSGATGRKEVA